MILQADKVIEQYFEKVKDKYPDIDYSRFEKICKMPFYFMRKQMENLNFPMIHIKYLGKFLVYAGKVQSFLRMINRRKDKNLITEEEYIENTKHLEEYLKQCNNEEVSNADD